MNRIECEFEADALAAVLQFHWPDRVEPELRAHIAACSICSGVVDIASALGEAREEERTSAAIPDSGLVWWRAQMRARREAAEAAGRPITAVQAIAFACAVGVLGAFIGATSAWLQKWLQAAAGQAESLAGMNLGALRQSIAAVAGEHQILIIAVAGMLCVIPTAVYFAIARD